MKRKRLIWAADIAENIQATPVSFDNEDFKQFEYTNYGNIAWVTPTEAQKIIDVFGNQYILEGAKKHSYYVNPKYLEAEVEALIWRCRGTTPIEFHDKGTYASTSKRLVQSSDSLYNDINQAASSKKKPRIRKKDVKAQNFDFPPPEESSHNTKPLSANIIANIKEALESLEVLISADGNIGLSDRENMTLFQAHGIIEGIIKTRGQTD
jgi:hypothetical protein